MNPLVSIVVPAYNHEGYVQRALDSALNQSYSNVELVVVNDGSQDGTWEEIQAYQARSATPFEAYSKPNGGISSALNYGIARSRGEYIAILASDDYFHLEKIERQVALFKASPADVGLVHSSAYLDYQDQKKVVSLTGTYDAAQGHCFMGILKLQKRIVAPSVLFTRSAYEAAGGFDETLVAEDVDFHAGVAAAGYAIVYDPMPLVYKTVTGTGLGTNTRKCFESHFKMLAKHAGRLTPEQYREVENTLWGGYGLTAARTGEFRLAVAAYYQLARKTRSVLPFAAFAYHAASHHVLATMPNGMRHRLRELRSKLAARRVHRNA